MRARGRSGAAPRRAVASRPSTSSRRTARAADQQTREARRGGTGAHRTQKLLTAAWRRRASRERDAPRAAAAPADPALATTLAHVEARRKPKFLFQCTMTNKLITRWLRGARPTCTISRTVCSLGPGSPVSRSQGPLSLSALPPPAPRGRAPAPRAAGRSAWR